MVTMRKIHCCHVCYYYFCDVSVLMVLLRLLYIAGFCTGYVSAIKSSITLVGGTSCKIVSAAAGLLTSAFKYVMGLTVHLL